MKPAWTEASSDSPKGCQKVAGGRSVAKTTGSQKQKKAPWKGARSQN